MKPKLRSAGSSSPLTSQLVVLQLTVMKSRLTMAIMALSQKSLDLQTSTHSTPLLSPQTFKADLHIALYIEHTTHMAGVATHQ